MAQLFPKIVLAHGSGGKLSHQLIEKMVLPQFQNELLKPLHDGAIFSLNGERVAFSTDSFVVSPIFSQAATSAAWLFMELLMTSQCVARARFISRPVLFWKKAC